MKHLWEQTREELVDLADTIPVSRTPLEEPPDDEEELWHTATSNRLHQNQPPQWKRFPVGSWAVEHWPTGEGEHWLWQLRQIPISELRRIENNNEQWLTDQYAHWYDCGSDFPPLRGVEDASGAVRISDGHHRLNAMETVGLDTALVWVNPSRIHVLEDGSRRAEPLTHEMVIWEALEAGKDVPPAALALYPHIVKGVALKRYHNVYEEHQQLRLRDAVLLDFYGQKALEQPELYELETAYLTTIKLVAKTALEICAHPGLDGSHLKLAQLLIKRKAQLPLIEEIGAYLEAFQSDGQQIAESFENAALSRGRA